jgi:anti-anti-sigma factor
MLITTSGEDLKASHILELSAVNCEQIGAELSGRLIPSARRITIDLSDTRFLDCAGLNTLVRFRNRVTALAAGAVVRVLNPGPAVRRLFTVMGLDSVFAISDADPLPLEELCPSIVPASAAVMPSLPIATPGSESAAPSIGDADSAIRA